MRNQDCVSFFRAVTSCISSAILPSPSSLNEVFAPERWIPTGSYASSVMLDGQKALGECSRKFTTLACDDTKSRLDALRMASTATIIDVERRSHNVHVEIKQDNTWLVSSNP